MNSLENISKLSNDELFRELKKRGVNVGPVSPTTRKIYEKKLESLILTKIGSKKSPSSVESEALSQENVLNYTDEELFKALKERGVDSGPIMPTTRPLYQKKLINLIKHSKIPGYPDLDRSISASTSPKKPTEIPMSIQTDFDSEIPTTIENKVPKLFPSLEFKLLGNETKSFHQPVVEKYKDEDSFLKINNFEISNKFGNPFSKFSHPNEKSNGSYLDYFQPKSQLTKKNLSKPKLNLDTDMFENKYGYYEQGGNRSSSMSSYDSLYNQPPPPQPKQSNSPVRLVNDSAEQKFNMGQFILSNYKLIFISICILIFLSILFSRSNDNPLDL